MRRSAVLIVAFTVLSIVFLVPRTEAAVDEISFHGSPNSTTFSNYGGVPFVGGNHHINLGDSFDAESGSPDYDGNSSYIWNLGCSGCAYVARFGFPIVFLNPENTTIVTLSPFVVVRANETSVFDDTLAYSVYLKGSNTLCLSITITSSSPSDGANARWKLFRYVYDPVSANPACIDTNGNDTGETLASAILNNNVDMYIRAFCYLDCVNFFVTQIGFYGTANVTYDDPVTNPGDDDWVQVFSDLFPVFMCGVPALVLIVTFLAVLRRKRE